MDELKKLEKAGEISQDDQRLYSEKCKVGNDRYDQGNRFEVLEQKQQEIMQV